LGALAASIVAAGNSYQAIDTPTTWQEKEAKRREKFQKKPLIETVTKLPEEEGSTS
jgi:hypothetical protein